jgi:hypothetical protein
MQTPRIVHEQLSLSSKPRTSDELENSCFNEIQEIANQRLSFLLENFHLLSVWRINEDEYSLFKLDEYYINQLFRINSIVDSSHNYLTSEDDQKLAYLLLLFPRSTDDLIYLLENGFPIDRVFSYSAQNQNKLSGPLMYNMITIASSISEAAVELLLTLGAKSCTLEISPIVNKFLRINNFPNLVVQKKWQYLLEIYLTGNDQVINSIKKQGIFNALKQLTQAQQLNQQEINDIPIKIFEENLIIYRKRRALDFFSLEDEYQALDKLSECKTEDDIIQLINSGFPLKKHQQLLKKHIEEINSVDSKLN